MWRSVAALCGAVWRIVATLCEAVWRQCGDSGVVWHQTFRISDHQAQTRRAFGIECVPRDLLRPETDCHYRGNFCRKYK